MTPKLVAFSREKSSKSLKKKFFKKKIRPAYLCRYDVRKIFWNKLVSRYSTFGDFTAPKNYSLHKIINKTRLTKKARKFHTPFWIQLSHRSSRKISAR